MTIRHYPPRLELGRPARFSGWLLAVFVIVAGGTFAVLAGTSSAGAQDGRDNGGGRNRQDAAAGWTMTPSGPLGPADRDLLVKVRLAGLWEAPAGRLAQDHAQSGRVKEVGEHLEHDHVALDEQVRAVAAKLGVPLPEVPGAEQQGWLTELTGKYGADFDATFANRLRAAHGKVFAAIATVRAGTRNDTVREFATTANSVVMKHMTLLESTGLVDYPALPLPLDPATQPVDRLAQTFGNGWGAPLVWVVLIAATFAGITAMVRIVRPR
jgi:predicted outer membrane protein